MKKFLKVLGILLAFCAAAAGGFYLYTKFKKKKDELDDDFDIDYDDDFSDDEDDERSYVDIEVADAEDEK